MANIELVIKISEEDYNFVKKQVADGITNPLKICIANGTPLPKGHGRLIILSEDAVKREQTILRFSCQKWLSEGGLSNATVAIIEADKEYEVKVVTRGNCMICGKELTEGLFFCKECGDKANSGK